MLSELLRGVKDLFTWWIVVTPWEQGVRVRLGKHIKLLHKGIHLRVPIIDRLFVQSTRLRYITIPTQTVTTSDYKVLTVSGGLAFAIKDVLKLYETIHDPIDTIQLMVCGAVAKAIEQEKASETSPQKIEDAVNSSISLEQYGINKVQFKFTDWALVRTYRLIQGEPKSWSHGADLNTILESSKLS